MVQVNFCYTKTSIDITFTAYNETNLFHDSSYGTNDPIYEYEVMESLINRRAKKIYIEFEVAPNKVTSHAFVYNPSKTRVKGTLFDGAYIRNPVANGTTAKTTMDRPEKIWISEANIPLGLLNVDDGQAKGTQGRTNFFRTAVDRKTFPDQTLGS
ncbi:hypothetical protein MMC18_001720 [Xylographa bjoerkii]|nr:hypothetical protein [Xylographa bjoerkii]